MSIGFDEIQLKKSGTQSIVKLVVKGKLDKQDYDAFVPQLDWLIEKNGKISMLVELVNFKGWTASALWEDTKFALKHFSDIEKMAVTGEGRQWQKNLTTFLKPFTRAEVRYFESGDERDAMQWLQNA